MCSLGELKARKASQFMGGADLVEYCREHLLRVYPAAKRINSSNYDPTTMWLVAIFEFEVFIQYVG